MIDLLARIFIGAVTGAAVGYAAVKIAEHVVNSDIFLDLLGIKKEIKRKCPSAFRAEILKRKNQSIYVGIFNDEDDMTDRITINATRGCDNSLQEGMSIAL